MSSLIGHWPQADQDKFLANWDRDLDVEYARLFVQYCRIRGECPHCRAAKCSCSPAKQAEMAAWEEDLFDDYKQGFKTKQDPKEET